MRTHVDLFSGIGGFALAAQANDVQTISFCEIDQRCRDFLSKTWPGVDIHDDINTFDAVRYAGRTWLLTAGVPCQPASRAGKQLGSADNRWLWPQAIRVLSAVRPTWALFENPPGIGDVGLAGVLADVESECYEVRVFSIPACAVGAPHRRERYWIVCHRGVVQDDLRRNGDVAAAQGRRWSSNPAVGPAGERVDGSMAQPRRAERMARHDAPRQPQGAYAEPTGAGFWANSALVACADGKFRRAPDDSFDVAHGLHRSLLAALGNSIVPQVAQRIIAAMIEAEATP